MLLGGLVFGIVVGIETVLGVVVLLAAIVVGADVGIDVEAVVAIVVAVELGNADDITVPFGYWQPHRTKPLGQVPTLWAVAPAGHVTSDGDTQEVRFAA